MWELFVWLFWYVAVPAGLAYLGGVLMAPSQPKAREAAEDGQSRSWNPHTLQQEGITRPRAYGKNLHHGNIVGKWTDIVDNREVLYLLIDHGDGPTKGIVTPIADNVFINDQPVDNFTSVSIQERLGTMNQTVMTGFEKPKLDYVLNTKLIKDEAFVFTTPNDFFDDLEFTILFPNGLRKYKKTGSQRASTLTLKVRISVKDAGSWTDISPSAISASVIEPYFLLYKISDYIAITRGVQYDIEFTNLTGTVSRHVNDVSLRSFREVVETAFTHPGRALVGIRAIATTQLSGSIDVKVIREDRIINTWNGSSWTLEYSNNRAWVAWDIMTLPVITGDGGGTPYAIERYDGIDPQYLDLEFFFDWAQFSSDTILDGDGGTEPRCAFNGIIDETTDTFSLVHKIAAVSRVNTYWSGHHLTGWIDDAVATPIDLVTMDSMMHKTWKNAWSIDKELAGIVEIFYKDKKQGYEKTSAEFANSDAGDSNNAISLEGIGITSRGVAIHYANYLLQRNELIRNTNKFKVHKDGFRYKLGEVLRIQSKIANWGHAFRVVSSTADTITVDRDASADVNVGDVLHIRSYDTVSEVIVTDTYEVASVVEKVITATINWDVTPIKGNLVAVGASGDVKLRRLIKLTPTMDNYFEVEVETYDVALYDADDLDPDNPNVNYVWPKSKIDVNAPLTKSEIEDLIAQAIPPQPDIDIPWPSNITWNDNTPSAGYISWSKTDSDDDIIFRLRGVDYEITPDNTNDDFVYWDPAFPTIFKTTNILSTAFTLGKWVMCRNKDGVAYPATPIAIMHGGIIQAGTIIANQIIITGINALELLNGPAEADADKTGSHQDDVNLANLGEKSLTSLDDKSLANLDEPADTKLTGIEAAATIDQTGAEIKTAYQAEANAYTDTKNTKLGGVEALADVTGSHQAATIASQGALATQSSVALNTGEVTNKSLANLDSAQDTKLNEIEPGADVTGDRLAIIASSMLPNWRLDIKDLAGRPAGIYPVASITDFSGLDWLDSSEAEINIAHASDNTIAYGFPAIPIDDKQKYGIVIRHKAPVASGSGLYLRMSQYDAALPAGKTHIGVVSGGPAGGPNCQEATNAVDLLTDGGFPGSSWEVDEYIYTPTSGTKYATFTMLNWVGAGLKPYHVDYVLMFLIPKTADEIPDGDTYGQIPKNWKDPIDPTKLNGSYIHDLTVDTLQIKDDAVTIPTSAYTSGEISLPNNSWITIQEISFSSTGSPVHIQCSVSIRRDTSGSTSIFLKLFRNAVEIFASDSFVVEYQNNAPMAFGMSDTPSSGGVTYYLKAKANTAYCWSGKISLLTLAIKK